MRTAIVAVALALGGCQWYEQHQPPQPQQVDNPRANPRLTVLRATLDENDMGDLTLLCIDSVVYIVIPGIGMAPKYTVDNGDPHIETCTNK